MKSGEVLFAEYQNGKGASFEEFYRLVAEEGTAVDGMTDDEVVAHMRRVRDGLWKAKHAGRP